MCLNSGGNPDSNTLLSDMTTVVCLDDYHCLDRFGRKEKGVTALDPKAQNFDLMYEQVRDIRDNKPIHKPIYNHVTGLLDPEETVKPPKVCFSALVFSLCTKRVRVDVESIPICSCSHAI